MIPPSLLALLYACLGSVFVLLLAVEVPPMQGPDEGAHFGRADQIARGELVSYRLSPTMSGGMIDLGTVEAVERFYPISIRPERRVERPLYAPIGWGRPSLWSFPNTALYPPFFYLPAAIAIAAGKAAGVDVLHTAMAVRVTSGMVSVAVGTCAILLAGSSALWLFALLLLPSSAYLMAAITQDGPMLASAALASVLAARLRHKSELWQVALPALCILLTLIGMARPPYAALAPIVLLTRAPPRSARIAAAAAVVTLTIGWWLLCGSHILVNVDPTRAADAGAQLAQLARHPGRLLPLVIQTMSIHFDQDYAGFFITTFPSEAAFRSASWCSLALAALLCLAGPRPVELRPAMLAGLCILAAAGGIFAIQYLTWTPVGAPDIRGVLGRYFLPLAAMLPAVIVRPPHTWRIASYLSVPVLAFPIAAIVITVHSIVLRYYI